MEASTSSLPQHFCHPLQSETAAAPAATRPSASATCPQLSTHVHAAQSEQLLAALSASVEKKQFPGSQGYTSSTSQREVQRLGEAAGLIVRSPPAVPGGDHGLLCHGCVWRIALAGPCRTLPPSSNIIQVCFHALHSIRGFSILKHRPHMSTFSARPSPVAR